MKQKPHQPTAKPRRGSDSSATQIEVEFDTVDEDGGS